MKKGIIKMGIVAMLLIIALPVVFSAFEETNSIAVKKQTGTPNLQVITLRYEPFPVNPGEYVDVWLQLGNEGDADIDDLTFEIIPEFPFSLDESETKTRYFGKVLANSMVLVHYKTRVSEDAIEGDAFLKYRYKNVDSDLKWTEGAEKIRIQTREAVLSIESVESRPETIGPGQEAEIEIKLKNLANSVIRDIGITLDITMSTVADNPSTLVPTSALIDSYYNAIPLAPLGSSTEKRISHLGPGEEAVLSYKVQALPDAESNVYKVPIKIEYEDELGRNYSKRDIVGLVIGSKPDIDASVEENTIYGRTTGDVSIKIVNKGVTDVKFMNVILKKSDAYDIISHNIVYVGDVDSDDYETVDFKIHAKKLGKDKVLELPIRLEYKDANNNEFIDERVISFKAYSLQERGLKGSGSLGKVIILLIILGGGWYLYKRWEKKKKKK